MAVAIIPLVDHNVGMRLQPVPYCALIVGPHVATGDNVLDQGPGDTVLIDKCVCCRRVDHGSPLWVVVGV